MVDIIRAAIRYIDSRKYESFASYAHASSKIILKLIMRNIFYSMSAHQVKRISVSSKLWCFCQVKLDRQEMNK